MLAINVEQTYGGGLRCLIQADSAPETMPVTGEGVTGIADEATLAAGSILYVVDEGAAYILGEDGATWGKWGGGTDTEG